MKKNILFILFLFTGTVINAQDNSSRAGTGTVIVQVNKNSVYSTQVVPVSAQAIPSEEAGQQILNYPGYHTIVITANPAYAGQKKQEVQVTNSVGAPGQAITTEKKIQSTGQENTKRQKSEVTNSVIKIE